MTTQERLIELMPRRLSIRSQEAVHIDIRGWYQVGVGEVNDAFINGSIGRDEWIRLMRIQLKRAHLSALATGHSGRWNEISQREFGRLGQVLRTQYGFLEDFIDAVIADPEKLNSVYMNNRSSLYGSASRQTMLAGRYEARGFNPSILPAIPGDGSSNCRVRCKCHWSFVKTSATTWRISWRLGKADHCETCVNRADRETGWTNLQVVGNQIITPFRDIRRRN